MAYKTMKLTCPGSTGNQTITGIGFTPVGAMFWATGKSGGSGSTSRFNQGSFDGTNNNCTATLHSGPHNIDASANYTDRCFVILSVPSGTLDTAVEATGVSFQSSGGGSCTLNFAKADNQYDMFCAFWD